MRRTWKADILQHKNVEKKKLYFSSEAVCYSGKDTESSQAACIQSPTLPVMLLGHFPYLYDEDGNRSIFPLHGQLRRLNELIYAKCFEHMTICKVLFRSLDALKEYRYVSWKVSSL